MTKPTTEQIAEDLQRIAYHHHKSIGDVGVADLGCAVIRLRELERENAELRAAIESAWGVIDDVIGECGCTQPNEILGSPPCFRCEKLELSAQALERTRKGELP